jgi:hypothetical protein
MVVTAGIKASEPQEELWFALLHITILRVHEIYIFLLNIVPSQLV